MSIGMLFGEMQAMAALRSVNSRINQALTEHGVLAGRLSSDLMISRDFVTFKGQSRQVKVADWKQYHSLRNAIAQILNLFIGLKASLLQQLDRYEQMRERDRVAQENAIEGGYGLF